MHTSFLLACIVGIGALASPLRSLNTGLRHPARATGKHISIPNLSHSLPELSQCLVFSRNTDDGIQIHPTINMTDTSGNPIQAHGGDILQQDGYFYWFGEDKTGETTSGHFVGVNCYRSADFQSWEHRGAVLTPQENTNISSASVVERPKVLYNDKNDEYVMWFHSDSSNYGAAMVRPNQPLSQFLC